MQPQQIYDEIEIRLFSYHGKGHGYRGEIELPYGESTRHVLPPELGTLDLHATPEEYGSQLYRWLFQGPLRGAFTSARGVINAPTRSIAGRSAIRLRLWLDPEDAQLQQIRWESLYDPAQREPLSITTAFSRFIRTRAPRNWSISERPLRILMLQAAPPQEQPTPVHLVGLNEMSQQLSAFITSQKLGASQDLQLDQSSQVETSPTGLASYHIVQITAQTVKEGGEDFLLLTHGSGQPQPMPPDSAASTLIPEPGIAPHLIILLTQPATETDSPKKEVDHVPAEFALQLVERGAQAVLSIHTPMEKKTLQHFMERFYTVLMNTGVIDVAVSAARKEIYALGDSAWVQPILHMRNPNAQLFTPVPESLVANMPNPIWQQGSSFQ